MSICTYCRKIKPDTLWEKIRGFFFRRFHKDIKDLRDDRYTQGIADGYKLGMERMKEISNETVKHYYGIEKLW